MPLIIVPTPIGNLEDITLRALRCLREADIIACEDTRRTAILLKKYHISNRTVSYHSHNEKERTEELMKKLRKGEKVALVSDAGTPGICDPGYVIIKKAIDEGIAVDVLPGPSAVISAIVLSGYSNEPFFFGGFLPDKKGERDRFLRSCAHNQQILVFYLSPHKALKHISSMIESLGNRKAVLCREMSKFYEEVYRGDLVSLAEKISDGIKGEMVIVIAEPLIDEQPDERQWTDLAAQLCIDGFSDKQVVQLITSQYEVSRNVVKRYMIEFKKLDKTK